MMLFINLTPIADINIIDAILEGLSFGGYIFIFLMAIYASKKNKIFRSKGFPLMILALLMIAISGFLDLFTEFYWIDSNYEIYKLVTSGLLILGFSLFTISLVLVFKFTQYMMGDD